MPFLFAKAINSLGCFGPPHLRKFAAWGKALRTHRPKHRAGRGATEHPWIELQPDMRLVVGETFPANQASEQLPQARHCKLQCPCAGATC
jgi:hypothetical protein